MALSASATLEGFATLQQTILHTYVKSSCGAAWGCWGGTTGGTSICAGTGSSIQADCIDGKDDAGIIYYITGVCHQIANRILFPAGIILPDAAYPDIRSSYFLYNEWGQNLPGRPPFYQWPNRANICATSGPPSGSARSSFPRLSGSGPMSFGMQGGQKDRRARVSKLVEAGLGHSVNAEICDALAEMQAVLQARQVELAQLLMTKEISKEKYIRELDEAMKIASDAGEQILGFEGFHKVFGEFRVHNLGDVSKFLSGGPTVSVG